MNNVWIGVIGVIIGVLVSTIVFMLIHFKNRKDLISMLHLSMLGVALFKVDLADAKTIQSTFNGLIGIGHAMLGQKVTDVLIDDVANFVEDIMKGDPDYGSDNMQHR